MTRHQKHPRLTTPAKPKRNAQLFDRNPVQDKKVTERELKEAGREGNLYAKPQGEGGPGYLLGMNIRDRFR